MAKQQILLGDCLDVLGHLRNVPAIVADPPANISFMGRSWDRAHPVDDYVLPCVPRSKAHERELRSEESFIRYWATRYAMAYDIADQHATAIIWTLPRTSYQTATAMRRAGWTIQDNLVHLFGTGWAKTGNALAPGQEGWLLATKGKPDLDIDACRVPRGGAVPMPGGKIRASRHFDGSESDYEMIDPPPGDPRGSLPKNALLSHCEECVRVGSKKVKASAPCGKPTANMQQTHAESYTSNNNGNGKYMGTVAYNDGSGGESVPAWHCLAGCVCGARSKWDPEKPLPRCPCGETWRWICAVAEVNAQSGESVATIGKKNNRHGSGCSAGLRPQDHDTGFADQGGASRFFNTFSYLSKCSSSERHAGCENLYWRANKKNPFGFDQVTREEWEGLSETHYTQARSLEGQRATERARGNVHPTVKSYRLIHWHHSLTGASKIVDLCGGSGSGMITAALDDVEWIGAEMCPEAVTIAQARHAFWSGLSHEARRAMIDEGIVPQAIETHERQQSLF